MPSEVLNIGKLMRDEARCYLRTLIPREPILNDDEEIVVLKEEYSDFKVSKQAVQEEMRFLEALIEIHVNGIRIWLSWIVILIYYMKKHQITQSLKF